MPDIEQQLEEDRRLRNAAREVFDGGVKAVKDDLAARSVGERIKDQAVGQIADAASEAIDVARESKGIIAGTLAALGLWAFRRPLLDKFGTLFGEQAPVQAEPLEGDETFGDDDRD